MKRHRQTDYHGSRSYEADEPVVTQFSLLAAWVGSIVRHKMRSWPKFKSKPASTKVPARSGKQGFSTLGADSVSKARGRASDCPFPTKPINDNPRDWRVFP